MKNMKTIYSEKFIDRDDVPSCYLLKKKGLCKNAKLRYKKKKKTTVGMLCIKMFINSVHRSSVRSTFLKLKLSERSFKDNLPTLEFSTVRIRSY